MTVGVVEGTFTGTGSSGPLPIDKRGNLTLSGGSGTARLERRFASSSIFGADDWHPVAKNADGDLASYSSPVSLIFHEPEDGVDYRVTCTVHSSDFKYRLSR